MQDHVDCSLKLEGIKVYASPTTDTSSVVRATEKKLPLPLVRSSITHGVISCPGSSFNTKNGFGRTTRWKVELLDGGGMFGNKCVIKPRYNHWLLKKILPLNVTKATTGTMMVQDHLALSTISSARTMSDHVGRPTWNVDLG